MQASQDGSSSSKLEQEVGTSLAFFFFFFEPIFLVGGQWQGRIVIPAIDPLALQDEIRRDPDANAHAHAHAHADAGGWSI